MDIEERLNLVKSQLNEMGAEPDASGLAVFWLRDLFIAGWKVAGIEYLPIKKGQSVVRWKIRLSLYRLGEGGSLEEKSRDF